VRALPQGGADEAFDFDALDALDDSLAAAPALGSRAVPPHGSAQPLAAPAGFVSMMSQSKRLRIALLVNGSRGDVQPMVVLGRALQQRKYEVLLLVNANHEEFCQANCVRSMAVFADMHWVIENIGGMGTNFIDGTRKGKAAAEQWFRDNPSSCMSAQDALEDFQPDLIICQATTSGPSLHHEMHFGVPAIPVYLHRTCFEYFQEQLEIQPDRPRFYAASKVVDSEALPDCKEFHQTGDFLYEERVNPMDFAKGGSLAHVKEFLAAGEPPIYIGWGSMIAHGLPQEDMLRLALKAVRSAGKRAVILGGWARLDVLGQKLAEGKGGSSEEDQQLAEFARTKICFAPAIPHAWLLPQCCAAVHHGGIGTMQAVLRAGLPSVITPIFADQFDNSRCLEALGAGVGLQDPLPKISWQQLALAISRCLSNKAMRAEARKASFKLQGESGVHLAARIVDDFMKKEVATGKWKASFTQIRGKPMGRQVSKGSSTSDTREAM